MARLEQTPRGLALQTDHGEICLDFLEKHGSYARPMPLGKKELIAKAVGAAKGFGTLIDATAGLGQDAVALAKLGFQVIALERSDLIFPLLQDAYQRALVAAQPPEWLTRLQFVQAEAISYLQQLSNAQRPQVIYLDPMYPSKKKDALPKLEMQVFRSLFGPEEDALPLLEAALGCAQERVVVKRPLIAPELGKKPNHSYRGKSVRYDMYSVFKV